MTQKKSIEEKKIGLTVYLTPAQKEAFDALAKKSNRSSSSFLQDLVSAFLALAQCNKKDRNAKLDRLDAIADLADEGK